MNYQKIKNQEEYDQIMSEIDSILQDATSSGGFQFLNSAQKSHLAQLSLLV